jgi:hypothetical protein
VSVFHILRPGEFATLIGTIGIEKQRRPLSQEMVFMRGTAKYVTGQIFMPRKDLPFPENIFARTVSQGQSSIIMKSNYYRPVGE